MKNLSSSLLQSNLTDQEIKFYYPTSKLGCKIFNKINFLYFIYIELEDANQTISKINSNSPFGVTKYIDYSFYYCCVFQFNLFFKNLHSV
jgi:hypothetical protein